MTKQLTLAERDFVAAFEANQIDPAAFDHLAHIHLAWCYLQRDGLHCAIGKLTHGLRTWATGLGKAEVYNESVTWFFALMIYQRILAQPESSFDQFVASNADLFAKDFLQNYYNSESLQDPRVKQHFILPQAWQQAQQSPLKI